MSLARKGLLVAGGSYATIAVQVVQTMILSRALGTDGSGRLAFYRMTCLLGFQIASLGLPTAMIHEINKGLNPPYLVLKNVIRSTVLLSLVAMAVLLLLTGVFFRDFFGNMPWPMLLAMMVLVPSLNLKSIFLNYSAIDLNAWRLAAISFFPPLVLVLCYLGAWTSIGINVGWAAFADAMIYAAGGAALGYWICRKSIALIRDSHRDSSDTSGRKILGVDWACIRNIVPFGLQLVLTDFLVLVNGYVLLALLRWFTHDFDEIGIYSRGLRLATLTIMAIQGLQRLLYSNWSKLEGDQQLRSVERVVNACFVMVIVLGVFVCFAATPLTLFLFGEKFRAAVPVTRITLIGLSAYMIVYLLQSYFNSLKKSKYNMIVFGVGIVVNLICGCILIPGLKARGAAWAVNCGYAAMTVTALYFACIKRGLRFRAMFVPDLYAIFQVVRSLLNRKKAPARAMEPCRDKDKASEEL